MARRSKIRNPKSRITIMANRKKKLKSSGESALGESPMDVGLLEQIVRLMSANDLSTVDGRDGEGRVILRGGQQVVARPAAIPAAAYPAAPLTPAAAPAAPSAAPADEESELVPIKSPMVGTFYAAPKPGEKPYVTV